MLFSQEESEKVNLSLSLQEAIDYAMENNNNVQNARLDIEAAKKEVWKTTAIGLPQANAGFDYQHLPGELPVIEFPTPDGSVNEISLGVRNSATYNVRVSQLVFSGEYIVGLQASRTFLQLSENSRLKSEIDTRESVSANYYTILGLERNRAILDSSLFNLDETLQETKALVDAGFVNDTDYDQLRITRNTIENSINAVERQVEVSYLLMKLNLGLSAEDEVFLTETLDEIMLRLQKESLLNQEFVVTQNIEYQILDNQERISELTVKREQSKYLPNISAFYLYQDRTNAPDFDITFNHILGINVAVPIFSSGQKNASVQQAKIELEKTRNNKEQITEILILAVEQARFDFRSAWEKYETDKMNIELAKKVYDETLIKFKNGISSSLDVTQANTQFLNSNSAYIQSVLEMLVARLTLEKALNNL
jgi:outer membrane protein TolC